MQRDTRVSRGRWSARWGVTAVIAAAAVSTTSAAGASQLAGGTDTDAAAGPLGVGLLADVQLRAAEESRVRASLSMRRQRAQSRQAFRDLDGSDVRLLASQVFPEVYRQPAWNIDASAGDASVREYVGAHAALVTDAEGKRSLVRSTLPMRTENEAGQLAPIDTSFVVRDGAFELENPLVAVQVGQEFGSEVVFPDAQIAVRPGETGADKAAARVGPTLMWNDIAEDLDYSVLPTPTGIQTFHIVRSVAAPERLALDLELPAGAHLEPAGAGGFRVLDGDREVATISPPVAKAADDQPVDVQLVRTADGLALDVAHRGRDVAYPILVDPQIVINQYDWSTNAGVSFKGWQFTETAAGKFTQAFTNGNRGLSLTSRPVTYGLYDFGAWLFAAPGDSTIDYAELHGVQWNSANAGMCLEQGLVAASWGWQSQATWGPIGGPAQGAAVANCEGAAYNLNRWFASSPRSPSPGNMVLSRIISTRTGSRSSTAASYLPAALVSVRDDVLPQVTVHGASAGWTKARPAISFTGSDNGLGMSSVLVDRKYVDAVRGRHATRVFNAFTGCNASTLQSTANNTSRCPVSQSAALGASDPGFTSVDGKISYEVWATDAVGNYRRGEFVTKVDSRPPTVEVTGPFTKDLDKKYAQPVRLDVKAKDGSNEEPTSQNDLNAIAGSGVKSAELLVDGAPASPAMSGAQKVDLGACPADSCEMDTTAKDSASDYLTFDPGALAPGDHEVRVRVTDHVGHTTTTAAQTATVYVDGAATDVRKMQVSSTDYSVAPCSARPLRIDVSDVPLGAEVSRAGLHLNVTASHVTTQATSVHLATPEGGPGAIVAKVRWFDGGAQGEADITSAAREWVARTGPNNGLVVCIDNRGPARIALDSTSFVELATTPGTYGVQEASRVLSTLWSPAVASDPSNALTSNGSAYVKGDDSTTIPKEPAVPVELSTPSGDLAIAHENIAESAQDGGASGDAAVVYPQAAEGGVDLAIKATDHGVETFAVVHSEEAADEPISLTLDLPGEERLVAQEDGTVAVVDPSPPPPPPLTTPPPPRVETTDPGAAELRAEHAVPADLPDADPNAAARLLSQAEEHAGEPVDGGTDAVNGVELPAPDPTLVPPCPDESCATAATAQTELGAAELRIADTKAEAKSNALAEVDDLQAGTAAAEAAFSAQMVQGMQTAPRAVAMVKDVWAKDANGADVATSVEVQGDTLEVSIDPHADTVFPVVIDPWVETSDWEWVWHKYPVYRTETYYSHNAVHAKHVANVHVAWCFIKGYNCAYFGNGWTGVGALGVFAQFTNEWKWYKGYHFFSQPVYLSRQVVAYYRSYLIHEYVEDYEWFDDEAVQASSDPPGPEVSEWSNWKYYDTSSAPVAYAAGAPAVAGVAFCFKYCPKVVSGFGKLIRKSPSQIPKVVVREPAHKQLAAQFTANAGGKSASKTLGDRLSGSAAAAKKMRKTHDAHHIVPHSSRHSELARAVLQRHGIHANDATNGVWLARGLHRGVHTNAYYHNLNLALEPYLLGGNRVLVEQRLQWFGQALKNGTIPY